jgi:hypothetical protein
MNTKPEDDPPKKRPLGMDRGKVIIADNFDDPMPDFADSFYEDFENDPLLQPPLNEPRTGD